MFNIFKTSLFIGYWLKQAHNSTYQGDFCVALSAELGPSPALWYPKFKDTPSFYLVISVDDVLKMLWIEINPHHHEDSAFCSYLPIGVSPWSDPSWGLGQYGFLSG